MAEGGEYSYPLDSDDTMTSTLRSTSSTTLPSMRTSNGNLHHSSSDGASEGTPSEEHPEFVDINVILPNGNITPITVEYGKQMMDLLVQVAAGNRLSPAAHTIHITNEETGRPMDYKASQSIGSLKISTIQLVPKKQDKIDRPKTAQPFEKTQRLTVNLPRNQKFVTRVNPKATLAEIYNMVCEEKNMDMYKYELRHPTTPDEALNMASPLEAYGLTEIVVVHIGATENHRPADYLPDTRDVESSSPAATMPRLKKSSSSTASEEGAASAYMPGQDGTRKKKKGVFSFLNKNRKAGSFKLGEATYSEPAYVRPQQQQQQQQQQHLQQHQPHQQRTATSPTPSAGALSNDSRASGSQSPVSQDAPGTVVVRNRLISRKKRPAPAPPPPSNMAPAPAAPAPEAPAPVAPVPVAAATVVPASVAPAPPVPVQSAPAPAPPVQSAPVPAAPAPAAPAPAAPAPTAPAPEVHIVTRPITVEVVKSEPPMSEAPPQPQVHSRNSSHSSGFDESNVSPLESPGVSTKTDMSEKTQISIDAPSVESTDSVGKQMKKSQSMPIRSTQGGAQIIKSTSLSTFKRKKRKAPAPPPPTGVVKPPAPRPIPEEDSGPVGANSSTHHEVVSTITVTESTTIVAEQSHNPAVTETIQKTEVHTNGAAPSPPSSPPPPQDEEDGAVAEAKAVTDLSKDLDDDASSSSGSMDRRRPRLCQFVPPPPPTSPPPPDTPVSPERARSFELIARGVEVVDSSIQVHVSSPRSARRRKISTGSVHSAATIDTIEDISNYFDATIAAAEELLAQENILQTTLSYNPREDGEFNLSPVTNDSFSHGSDTTSENSSITAYEVNEIAEDALNTKTDSEDEELPMYPNDPDGIVLIKKVSLVETEPELNNGKEEHEEEVTKVITKETTVVSSLVEATESGVPETPSIHRDEHVTVISVGGEPDIAGASDSGHSSATLDKSEDLDHEIQEPLPMESELVFDDNDVLYVEPLNPGNMVAVEEYHNQVERERLEAETGEREHGDTPQKSAKYENPVSTSTPMIQSVTQTGVEEQEEGGSFTARPPSPVEAGMKDHDSSLSDVEDPFLNGEEPMISLNDYRVVGLIKEEVIDFSYAKHSKPLEINKKETEPTPPMVTSLRQKYVRRPIVPREPIDIPDLEAMGLMRPRELPPPPSEPAPPPPQDPPEPIHHFLEKNMVEEKERVHIQPHEDSFTDHETLGAEVIEVIEPSDISEQESELSIPNEAEPETLIRDRAKQISVVESSHSAKPVSILKHSISSPRTSDSENYRKTSSQDSFYSDSSLSTSSKGILKASSVSSEDSDYHSKDYHSKDYHSKVTIDNTRSEDVFLSKNSPELVSSKPQGILKNTESGRTYSSSTALHLDEKEEDTKEFKPRVLSNRPSLGVYGPRPWGASRHKSESNIIESVSTQFGHQFSKEKEAPSVKENGNVRQRMSEIGFAPNSEREKEDVLEEKSLSMMNLRNNPYKGLEARKAEESQEKVTECGDSKRSLQMQYEELQQQFNKWQKQLMDNQALLSRQNITEGDEANVFHEMQAPEPVKQTGVVVPQQRVGGGGGGDGGRSVSYTATVETTSTAPVRKQADARYEPKKKTTPDTGGGGKFTTNDLLSAKSRLRSSGDDVEEKGGIELGRVVDAPVTVSLSRSSVSSQEGGKSISLPRTPPPSTKDFPPPPRRVLIEPLVSNPTPKPIGGVRSRFEPKLDPREELMIAIRNNGGRTALRRVAVAETTWAKPE